MSDNGRNGSQKRIMFRGEPINAAQQRFIELTTNRFQTVADLAEQLGTSEVNIFRIAGELRKKYPDKLENLRTHGYRFRR